MVGPTMNLISGTHHSYGRKEYAFMVLREYTIISRKYLTINLMTIKFFKFLNRQLKIDQFYIEISEILKKYLIDS